MIQIKPVSYLRNKFTEIESLVKEGEPVFLTKNGEGSMVVMSIEQYALLTDPVEQILDVADYSAATTKKRCTHEQAFKKIKEALDD